MKLAKVAEWTINVVPSVELLAELRRSMAKLSFNACILFTYGKVSITTITIHRVAFTLLFHVKGV